eukprot:SAG11_NODE_36067_length_263_cov_1.231707_1_plen_32_part_10
MRTEGAAALAAELDAISAALARELEQARPLCA